MIDDESSNSSDSSNESYFSAQDNDEGYDDIDCIVVESNLFGFFRYVSEDGTVWLLPLSFRSDVTSLPNISSQTQASTNDQRNSNPLLHG